MHVVSSLKNKTAPAHLVVQKLMKGNPIIWITILMGSWTSLWSNPTILTLSELPDTAISIKSQLLLFADATRQMTWEEVYQQYQANQFRPFEGYPFKGELQRVNYEYWLYFSLEYKESIPKRAILRGFTDAKCFHLKDQRLVENLVVGRGITDNFKKASKYAYGRRDIPILLLPGKNIFLIQKSPENRFHPNTIQPFLLKEELAIAKKDSTLNLYYLAFGLFLGFLSCVFVFICMQYSQSKHISYLYFALHILFFFLLNLRQLDISTPYFHFYPNLIYTHKSHNVFHLPIYLTFILFIRSFLNTKENFLQVDKVVRGIIFGIIVYFVLDRIIIFFDGIHYTYWIDRYVRPAFFVLSIYITLSFYKSKNKVVKYIANGIMSLVVLTLLGLILDRVMVKTWDWWDLAFIFTQLGVILEITFFALAIGHNVKIIEDDKNHAEFALQSQEQETQQLKELDQYKDQFYTNITHELRTPLTIIKGLTQQIKENPSVDLEERLSIVIKNTEGLHHLINQVLDLSKMEVGKVSVNNKQEDIIRPIKNWTDSFIECA